jgi:outer membrane protein assembly factor BamB
VRRPALIRIAILGVGALGLLAPPAALGATAATLSLAPDTGPPTSEVRVQGRGFAAREVVAVFFDGARVASGAANPRGKLTAQLVVPAAAVPGAHEVSARGESSGLVASAGFLVRTDWTQFHFDAARTGWNQFENVLSPGTVSGIIVYDSHGTGGPIAGSPVYCGGRVVVGSGDGNVYAQEPHEPDFDWVFRTGGAVVGSPVTIPPGPCRVLVASTDGRLYALHGATGEMEWSVDLGAPVVASPLLIHGQAPREPDKLLVGDRAGVLHAFDLDGNRLWATQLDGPISGAPSAHTMVPPDPDAPAPLQLDPGDRIYVGSERGTLYSLNPGDGSVAFATALDGPIVTSPLVLHGFDPQPDPPRLIVGTTAGTLYGLFADDATEIWRLVLGAPIVATPAIGSPNLVGGFADPWVFVATADGTIGAFEDPDERPSTVWQTRLPSPTKSSPTLANGVLYLGADDSKLHALDAFGGRELFASAEITATTSSPIIADGSVFIGTEHGELVAFAPPPE